MSSAPTASSGGAALLGIAPGARTQPYVGDRELSTGADVGAHGDLQDVAAAYAGKLFV